MKATQLNYLIRGLALVPLLLLTIPAVAQAEDYTYTTNDDGTITITGYTGPGGAVVIPDTINGLLVASIGDFAFYDGTSLTSVTIPNSVTNIGGQAFNYCPSLTNVMIGNGVTSIGYWAFSQCYSLTRVTIPGSVTNIGYGALSDCSSLRKVYFQGNAPSADPSVFSWDDHVTVYFLSGTTGWGSTFGGYPAVLWNPQVPYTCTKNNGAITITGYPGLGGAVTIPDTINGLPVSSIGDGAFSYDNSLTSVTIPRSVTNIGNYAFAGCTGLTSIIVDAANSSFSSVAGVLFNKIQTTLLACPGGKAGSYAIPNGVTAIGDSAFAYCSRLTGVTIPASVTSVGEKAFGGCTSLIGVYLQGNTPSVGSSVFDGDNNATVYYLSGTTGWGASFCGLPTFMMYQMYPPYLVTRTSDDGPGSLRQAILNANANGEGDIVFWSVTGTNVLLSALPAITANVNILGLGASSNVISGNRLCRVFDITASAACTLSGLTIRDGAFQGSFDESGAGIRSFGYLTINNCLITENGRADSGGGIASAGVLVLNNVKITKNVAWYDGGIDSSGSLTITNSEISGNDSMQDCGGIECSGTSVLSNVLLSGNMGWENFGGIEARGNLVLIDCNIEGNYADHAVGGISFVGDNVYALNCSINNNYAAAWTGGGEFVSTNTRIVNSTIDGNFASYNLPGLLINGTATISNSTVSGNVLGYLYGRGGGIENQGTLNLANCTVSGNYSRHHFITNTPPTFGIDNNGTVSALHCTITDNECGVQNSGMFFARDTVIANNTNGLAHLDFSGVLTSQGFNLIGNLTNTTVIGDTTGNIYSVDPVLGPLQDNGGPTWTHALLPGSLAIDAGSSAGLTTDQRGVPRPYDVACIPNAGDGSDIGAYEWTPTPAASEDLAVQEYARLQVASMVLKVNQSGVSNGRPLAATLRAAQASLDRGNSIAAANQLHAFQNKVNAQSLASNPVVAQELIQNAQAVIDAVRCDGFAPKVHSVKRQPDGKVQLSFSALALQAPIVEASTNMVDWEVIGVGLNQGNGLFEFEDANAARFPQRFYRLVSP